MSGYAVDFSTGPSHGGSRNSTLSAIMTAGPREVVRCHRCLLVQFRTTRDLCRRCAEPLTQPQLDLESSKDSGGSGNGGEVIAAPASPARFSRGEPRSHSKPRHKTTRELSLGPKLRELRESRNWTQEQMADVARVPRTYISRVENSRVLPRPAMLHRFAKALDMAFLDLLRDNPQNGSDDGDASNSEFWNSFLQYFGQLRAEQKFAVLSKVRAAALPSPNRPLRPECPAPGHASQSLSPAMIA